MSCDNYLELLALRPEGSLSEEEDRALAEHLAVCPACRAAEAQLAALQAGFDELEDIPAPEGFAQGVMDRIREETRPKVVPLFKRPQVRALAGLAACLVLVVGLYGASRPHNLDVRLTRSTTEGLDDVSACKALTGDESGPRVNAALVDPQLEDAPQISAYAATSQTGGAPGQRAVPDPAADGLSGDWAYAEVILTLDRMPEGGWELIPPDTFVSPVGLTVSVELLEQLEQLALEQEIGMSRVSGPEINDHCLIIILDEES